MGVEKIAYPIPVFKEFYPHVNVLMKTTVEFYVPVGKLDTFG